MWYSEQFRAAVCFLVGISEAGIQDSEGEHRYVLEGRMISIRVYRVSASNALGFPSWSVGTSAGDQISRLSSAQTAREIHQAVIDRRAGSLGTGDALVV